MIEFNKVTWYSRIGALVLFIGVIPALSFYLGMQYEDVQHATDITAPVQITHVQQERKEVARALYQCDNKKTISAVFFEGPKASIPKPGEPPVPTGSVEVSLDGASSINLAQTLSGSGVRYANADESFVFWNKGNTALIMRNNTMDLTYSNCATK